MQLLTQVLEYLALESAWMPVKRPLLVLELTSLKSLPSFSVHNLSIILLASFEYKSSFVVSSGSVSRLPNSVGMTSMNDSLTSLLHSCDVSSAATTGRLPSAALGSLIS